MTNYEQRKTWILIARNLAGEASEKEIKELGQLIKDNPELSYQYGIILNLWNSTTSVTEEADEKEFQKILKKINTIE